MSDLDIIRRHYAEELAWLSGIEPGPLVEAFATVPRERFLGAGPWQITQRSGYRQTPDADPRHLYHNVLVGLVPERRLNNGQPSFLAALIHAARIAEGEHVVHLGCGVGYFTAVMAEVVGARGRVTAIEADPDLAARAIENLSDRANVRALQGDAAEADFDAADVVFVNFGMTHPLRRWVERVKPGGRLQLPITASSTLGTIVRFERLEDGISAQAIGPTQIFSSVSGRDPALEPKLTERFFSNPMAAAAVSSLRLDAHAEEASCWLHGGDVCLSTRRVGPAHPLDIYAGTYHVGPGADVTFRVRGDVLHAQSPAAGGKLVSQGEDCFELPGVGRVHFERDAGGLVTAVTIEMGGQSFVAKRIA